MGRDDDATHTTLNGALVQVHPNLFFPHGKGRTCSLITVFFFNLLNCSCKFPIRHLFSAWSFSREIFLSAFMISVVLTIQLQLRHIIILQGWWSFFLNWWGTWRIKILYSCFWGYFFGPSLNLGGGKICPRGHKVQPIPPPLVYTVTAHTRCYDENATELKLVQEWVVKCPKNLFAFADMSHWSWLYEVGILPKDRNFIPKIWNFCPYS